MTLVEINIENQEEMRQDDDEFPIYCEPIILSIIVIVCVLVFAIIVSAFVLTILQFV